MAGFSTTDGLAKTIGDSAHRGLASVLDRLVVDVILAALIWILPHQPKDIVPLILFAVFVAMLLLTVSDVIHFVKKNGPEMMYKKEKVPVRERLQLAHMRALGERTVEPRRYANRDTR